MATQPAVPPDRVRNQLPDYLPARLVNEYVYCPRLFFYEWVDGLFRESADTLEGKAQHARVDAGKGELAPPEELGEEKIHSRSVMLASEQHRLIAKMDLLEIENGRLTPVDYKHGQPREGPEGIEVWPADRIQLGVQGLILRDNGYTCDEGLIYYAKTRQRVRVPFEDALMAEVVATASRARRLAEGGEIPPPLEDSPKCVGCSLAGICLPDETNRLREEEGEPEQMTLFGEEMGAPRRPPGRAGAEVRRLVAARDDLKPVYLNTQGLRAGKSGAVLQVKEKDALRHEFRLNEICQVNLMGNIQLTTQAIQALCESEIPVCYFSQGGWFYGITTGLNTKNVFLRQSQFRLADNEGFCVRLARKLVAGKVRNQRTLLMRNHVEPPRQALSEMKEMAGRAETAESLAELLGLEGNAARLYFGAFSGMVKGNDGEASELGFDFSRRNRRPPADPVNALLSLAYSILAKDLTIACYSVGFDPFMGFYHQPRFGRPALALDLMEPFRPLIADSAVLSAINTGMVGPRDFVRSGSGVSLTPGGRKGFYRAYELRMDTLATHPLFEYRVSYRRMLEIQARLLGRLIDGEVGEYPVFITR